MNTVPLSIPEKMRDDGVVNEHKMSRESILNIFHRLVDDYPWLKNTKTEDEMYSELSKRIESGIIFTRLIQQHCKLQPALPQMEEEFRVYMKQHSISLEEHSKKYTNIFEQMSKQFDDRNIEQTKRHDKTLDVMESITKSVHNVSEQKVKLFSNASTKGAQSELWIQDEFIKHFPDMDVENTTGRQGSCDIHLNPTQQSPTKGKVLVEIKNYSDMLSSKSNKVPTKEVDKFVHDVKHWKPPLALMVALDTGITGKGRFQFERIGNTLILFISNASPYSAVLGVSALQEMYALHNTFHTQPDEEHIARENIETKLHKACSDIETVLENNSFFAETIQDIKQLDNIRNKLLDKLESHKKGLSTLAQSIRKRFECEIELASVLTPTDDYTATTPDDRRALYRQVADILQPSKPPRQEIAISTLLDVVDIKQLGLTKTNRGFLVKQLNPPNKSIAVIELKKTKTVLFDINKHVQLELTNRTVPKIQHTIQMFVDC